MRAGSSRRSRLRGVASQRIEPWRPAAIQAAKCARASSGSTPAIPTASNPSASACALMRAVGVVPAARQCAAVSAGLPPPAGGAHGDAEQRAGDQVGEEMRPHDHEAEAHRGAGQQPG